MTSDKTRFWISKNDNRTELNPLFLKLDFEKFLCS